MGRLQWSRRREDIRLWRELGWVREDGLLHYSLARHNLFYSRLEVALMNFLGRVWNRLSGGGQGCPAMTMSHAWRICRAARSGGIRPTAVHSPGHSTLRRGLFGWAALCSVNNSTALLAFRNDHDKYPVSVVTSKDRDYLQDLGGDNIVYSREITTVGRAFIMSHYRAYGGPEPPPINHQAIDDAFLEKASNTWYFYRGKWLRLQGAD